MNNKLDVTSSHNYLLAGTWVCCIHFWCKIPIIEIAYRSIWHDRYLNLQATNHSSDIITRLFKCLHGKVYVPLQCKDMFATLYLISCSHFLAYFELKTQLIHGETKNESHLNYWIIWDSLVEYIELIKSCFQRSNRLFILL